MVRTCMFCGAEKLGDDLTYHGFPLMAAEWIRNMGLGSNFVPPKNAMLCSSHFEKKCFQEGTGKGCLLPGSIPTIFGQYKAGCVFCHARKGQDKNISFRKFPLNNAELLQKWIAAMAVKDFVPNKRSVLCSEHFEKDCFRKTGRNACTLTLRNNAVPTIFKLPLIDKTTAEEHNSNSQLSASHMETDPSLSPEILAAYEGREKRRLSLDLPPPKMSKTDNNYNMVNQMKASTSDSDKQCQVDEVPSTSTASEVANTRMQRNGQTPTTSRRIRHIYHDHRYQTTPRSMLKKMLLQKKRIQALMLEKHAQNQHISRLKKQVTSLKQIVSALRKTPSLPDSGLECLESIADTDVSQFLKRFIKNQNNIKEQQVQNKKKLSGISSAKYPAALRAFAMTLHFYSPRAYGFVRRKFCKALPDPSTIRSWYSAVDGEPGFTLESFQALKFKAAEAKKCKKKVLVSFMLDEISIKRSIQRLPNGCVRGYVNMGTEVESNDTIPLAKEALVMMVVALDGNWKLPIGYFLVSGVNSATKSGLVSEALIRLHDVDVEVVSVTLDGPTQNFATMRALGADFSISNTKPFFLHPSTQKKVFVIFDACHMLKLARNCLGDIKVFKDGQGKFIRWEFIESLARIQDEEGLRAGNRLRTTHIRYWKMKMKVSLAAQTLSSSVADSIEYCCNVLQLREFRGSEATVRFIRCLDRVFDFLNSRNPFAKGYKAPLRASNEEYWREAILAEVAYLKDLTDVTGVPMWQTRRHVTFVGLITAVTSIIEIFDCYVKPETSQLQYLLTYKFSQDHLELFFCAIRSCGGWCPNPTSSQFVSAYKRLLIRHEVHATNGNSEAMDSTTVLSVPSTRKLNIDRYDSAVYDTMVNVRVAKKYGLDDNNESNFQRDEFYEEFDIFRRKLPNILTHFSKACVANIAGWVVKKLVDERRPIVRCIECREALFQESQKIAKFHDNLLIQAKTRGGLIFPCKSVVLICQRTEEFLRSALNRIDCMVPPEKNFPAVLCSKVLQDLFIPPCILFSDLEEHVFSEAVEDANHLYLLSKHVCQTYIEVRMYAATNLASQIVTGDKMRNHLTRQIIWQHQ